MFIVLSLFKKSMRPGAFLAVGVSLVYSGHAEMIWGATVPRSHLRA